MNVTYCLNNVIMKTFCPSLLSSLSNSKITSNRNSRDYDNYTKKEGKAQGQIPQIFTNPITMHCKPKFNCDQVVD